MAGSMRDRCTDLILKPYNAARLLRSLDKLGVRCKKGQSGGVPGETTDW